MKNKQYKKTEEKILTVFFDNPNYTMRQLAKKAGIARSTIYTHHHSVRGIIPDCEKYILEEYDKLIKRKLQTAGLKILYLDILVFMINNRQIFKIFLKFGDREIVIKMFLKLKLRMNEPEKILRIWTAEMTEIIFEWGEREFSEKELERVLADMMYLTKSCHERLKPIW